MGVTYFPDKVSAIKSIQTVTVAVNMAATSTGTVNTTISEVDPDKSIVLPPSQWSGIGTATNFGVISNSITSSTNLETAWENDTSIDPASITIRVVIIEFY